MSHSEFRLSNKCPWPKQIPAIKICKKKGNGLSAPKTTTTTVTAKLKLESRKQSRRWVLWACIFQIQIAQQYLFQNGKNKNVSFRFEFFSSEKPSENLLAPPPLHSTHSPSRLHFILVNKQQQREQQKERQKTEKLAPKLTFTWQRVEPFGGWCCYCHRCCCCCSFWGNLAAPCWLRQIPFSGEQHWGRGCLNTPTNILHIPSIFRLENECAHNQRASETKGWLGSKEKGRGRQRGRQIEKGRQLAGTACCRFSGCVSAWRTRRKCVAKEANLLSICYIMFHEQ